METHTARINGRRYELGCTSQYRGKIGDVTEYFIGSNQFPVIMLERIRLKGYDRDVLIKVIESDDPLKREHLRDLELAFPNL